MLKELRLYRRLAFEETNSYWYFIFKALLRAAFIVSLETCVWGMYKLAETLLNGRVTPLDTYHYFEAVKITLLCFSLSGLGLGFVHSNSVYLRGREGSRSNSRAFRVLQGGLFFAYGAVVTTNSRVTWDASLADSIRLATDIFVGGSLSLTGAIWFYRQVNKDIDKKVPVDNRYIRRGLCLGMMGSIVGSLLFSAGTVLSSSLFSIDSLPTPNLGLFLAARWILFAGFSTCASLIPGAFGGAFLAFWIHRSTITTGQTAMAGSLLKGTLIGALTGAGICFVTSVIFSSPHLLTWRTALFYLPIVSLVASLMGLCASYRLAMDYKKMDSPVIPSLAG